MLHISQLQVVTPLNDVKFNEKDIVELLAGLHINKSPGPDGLHSRVLKETSKESGKPLKIISPTF